jgi:hypothetical protein
MVLGRRINVESGGKWENESTFRPLVGFDVLNDNLIKGLISFVKCISRS